MKFCARLGKSYEFVVKNSSACFNVTKFSVSVKVVIQTRISSSVQKFLHGYIFSFASETDNSVNNVTQLFCITFYINLMVYLRNSFLRFSNLF